MRILTITNLYPNCVQPRHGIFIEQRLKQLLATRRLEAKVVAPVPWFPFKSDVFGVYGKYAAIPCHEQRDGVEIFHPRYPAIPKIGMSISPVLMAQALKSRLLRLIRNGYDFDLIDAHYFYPDGVASVILGRWLKKPVVVTGRGTDLNVLPAYRLPRQWIRWASAECSAIITVSCALKARICRLGVPDRKVVVLRNGVDLSLFRPLERDACRRGLDESGPLLLSVGNLVQEKGHDIVISALPSLPHVALIIVGEGRALGSLKKLANSLGVRDRVKFVGTISQPELVRYYNAADVFVLASVSEGMPNVVLESIACGTPVVATATGGTREIITCPEAGQLMQDRSVSGLVEAFEILTQRKPDRAATRRHGEAFGWENVTHNQLNLYEKIIDGA